MENTNQEIKPIKIRVNFTYSPPTEWTKKLEDFVKSKGGEIPQKDRLNILEAEKISRSLGNEDFDKAHKEYAAKTLRKLLKKYGYIPMSDCPLN